MPRPEQMAPDGPSNAAPFWSGECAPGVVLCAVAALALCVANSPWSAAYQAILEFPIAVRASTFEIAKPLLLWINDGLMAVFFFLVGLELKRELLAGELSNPRQALLPVAAATGGMAAPVPDLCRAERGRRCGVAWLGHTGSH